jgi:SAM-dependent methyltransferase
VAALPSAEVQDLIRRYYPSDTHPYRVLERRIDKAVKPGTTILDIGCGRTAPDLSRLRGHGARLVGIDLVRFTVDDPDLELHDASVERLTGIADGSIDFAYSRAVMEHVERPALAFAEIARVLKPDGRYLALTPSFWDYGSLISWVVPNAYHGWLVKRLEGRAEEDTFPAFYRANTRPTVEGLARDAGLEVAHFEYLGQYPNYLMWNRTLFRLGCVYERLIARFRILHPLRGWVLYELRKPPA